MEAVKTYVYRLLMSVVTVAGRLQSGPPGRLSLYMLIALVAIIAVVTALA